MKTTNKTLFLILALLLLSTSCVEQVEEEVCDSFTQACDGQDNEQLPGEGGDDQSEQDDSDDGAGDDNSQDDDDTDTVEDDSPRGNPFNSPWKREDTSIVIDAYELNPINWNQMATDPKMVGVIHRSSIGMRVDRRYNERKRIAKERGYLWGAYHLGSRDDTIAQAELFLSLIDGEEDTLMVLDLEDTNNSRFMTLDQAEVFMEYIYEKTGRIPVVYANHSTTRLLNQRLARNPLIQQSKLWYARFKANVTDFPRGIWDEYFLWQFSSEINCSKTGSCLYNVPGTAYDMDVNVYNGNEAQLRYEWSSL